MISVGDRFPDFEAEGFDSAAVRTRGPLVAVVWHPGCSTSRLSVPLFDRLQTRYPEASVVGICQEPPQETEEYARRAGLAFRQIPDGELRVSGPFGVDTVPSYFVTDASGEVRIAGQSWDVALMEEIAAFLALRGGKAPEALTSPEDGLPRFKPG